MKTMPLLALLIAGALPSLLPVEALSQDLESMPPVVIKTVPESGVKDVAPGEMEVKVIFSKEMANGSWSWSTAWENSAPEIIGKPKYAADHKTCIVKVKLEPNKTYAWWLNSNNFHNFKDSKGHAAVPYLLVFQTRDQ